MRYSVREAKAKLSELIAKAEAGEEVVITRNGKAVVEVAKAKRGGGLDLDALNAKRRELGIEGRQHVPWPDEFDDPAFSWRALGFEDEAERIETERGWKVGQRPANRSKHDAA